MAAVAAAVTIASAPTEPSTVLFGEILVSECRPIAVPTSMPKMSVNAMSTITKNVSHMPFPSIWRMNTKYVSSFPMYRTASSV